MFLSPERFFKHLKTNHNFSPAGQQPTYNHYSLTFRDKNDKIYIIIALFSVNFNVFLRAARFFSASYFVMFALIDVDNSLRACYGPEG